MISNIAELRRALEPFYPEQQVRVNETAVIDFIPPTASDSDPVNIKTKPGNRPGRYGKFGDPNNRPEVPAKRNQ